MQQCSLSGQYVLEMILNGSCLSTICWIHTGRGSRIQVEEEKERWEFQTRLAKFSAAFFLESLLGL
jgi:hypothetical protein